MQSRRRATLSSTLCCSAFTPDCSSPKRLSSCSSDCNFPSGGPALVDLRSASVGVCGGVAAVWLRRAADHARGLGNAGLTTSSLLQWPRLAPPLCLVPAPLSSPRKCGFHPALLTSQVKPHRNPLCTGKTPKRGQKCPSLGVEVVRCSSTSICGFLNKISQRNYDAFVKEYMQILLEKNWVMCELRLLTTSQAQPEMANLCLYLFPFH